LIFKHFIKIFERYRQAKRGYLFIANPHIFSIKPNYSLIFLIMKQKTSLVNLSGLRKTFGSNVFTAIILLIFLILSSAPPALSQYVPQGFNYQALVRDGEGEIMSEVGLHMLIDIENASKELIWSEMHDHLMTNHFGLVSIVVGTGTRQDGTVDFFDEIDWNAEPLYLRTWINLGEGFIDMGNTLIWSVPYSLVAKDVEGPVEKLGIEATTTALDEALFEVKNHTGQTVFAVYNEGVRIYVDDGAKGPKGGFAIGGFGTEKAPSMPLLVVDPDSIRMYIDKEGKTTKGGFAIGGYGTDKADIQDFLFISDDSVRVYIDNEDDDYPPKGVKGGFAIGGYGTAKGPIQNLLTVSNDSVRIYLDKEGEDKGPKGGFAIGGFGATKGEDYHYFDVSIDTNKIIDPSQNRILWYPEKNAFLTGKVLIEKKDSVGTNSMSTGFESKAIGNYSQAMGYKAIARGDYSTAIGKNAIANEINTFAFGEDAVSGNSESYAFGRGAIANGYRSFSFGSAGIDTLGNPTDVTKALGDYSFAIGQGSFSTGVGSFALGVADTASGDFSTALGTKSAALGDLSIVIGSYSTATNYCSTAMGYYTVASGRISTSMGQNTKAIGATSVAMGEFSQSIGRSSFAMGYSSRSYGAYSIAGGYGSIARGLASFAMGNQSKTEGTNTTAIGQGAIARGYYTASIGRGTIARSRSSFVVGEYNDSITTSSTEFTWVDTDPIFIIGNGQSNTTRHNAVTVLKNGNVGIGTVSPGTTLAVAGLTGTSSGSYLKVFNDDFYYASSSEKTKKDIEPLKEDFYKILNAQPVSFTDIATGERNIGYIAERFDELGLNNLVIYKDGEPMALSYELVSLYNLEIIKEQQEQIDELKQIILEMQDEIASLHSQ
jgi:hypothetical protein